MLQVKTLKLQGAKYYVGRADKPVLYLFYCFAFQFDGMQARM